MTERYLEKISIGDLDCLIISAIDPTSEFLDDIH